MSPRLLQEGYREGITAGKLANLQAGFDDGYILSSSASRQLGFLRGSSSSLLACLLATPASRHPGPSSPPPRDLDKVIADTCALIARLSRVRAADIIPADKEAETHAREHDGIDWEEPESKEMDELERALENVGKDRKGQEDKIVLDQLEETLESLLERAGLRA